MHGVTTIGLDIAKSVFQVQGIDAIGNVVIRRQPKRAENFRTQPLGWKEQNRIFGRSPWIDVLWANIQSTTSLSRFGPQRSAGADPCHLTQCSGHPGLVR